MARGGKGGGKGGGGAGKGGAKGGGAGKGGGAKGGKGGGSGPSPKGNSPPPPPESKGLIGHLTSGRLVNGFYTGTGMLSAIRGLAGFVSPQFYHEITVAVKGGPAASMNRVWQIACALCWGQLRHRPPSAMEAHNLECTWDLTAKAVKITCSYNLGLQSDFGAREFIQRGPIVETIGAYWPSFLGGGDFQRIFGGAQNQQNQQQELRGGVPAQEGIQAGAVLADFFGVGNAQEIGNALGQAANGNPAPGQAAKANKVVGGRPVIRPENPFAVQNAILLRRQQLINAGLDGQFDVLPDNGRLLLTEAKTDPSVQPPAPDDYSDLISLVANTLTDPGFLPPLPPEGRRYGNPLGLQVHPVNQVLVDGGRQEQKVLYGKLRKILAAPVGVFGGILGALFARAAAFAQRNALDGYLRRDRVPLAKGPEHDGR